MNELKNSKQKKADSITESAFFSIKLYLFLFENFFDLHYKPNPDAQPINLGVGHLWKLAIDHPESHVQPCIHRAPKEKAGENRLLLIC